MEPPEKGRSCACTAAAALVFGLGVSGFGCGVRGIQFDAEGLWFRVRLKLHV